MWLAPNLPDEGGEKRRRGGRERERREFGRSRFRSLLPSETPKTETNHDNDSHETLFETRATHHTVHVLHAQDVCVPFPAILSDGNLIRRQAAKSSTERCSQAFHIRRQNIAIKYFLDPPLLSSFPLPPSSFGFTISTSIRFEAAPSFYKSPDSIRCEEGDVEFSHPSRRRLPGEGASFSGGISKEGRRGTTVLAGCFTCLINF